MTTKRMTKECAMTKMTKTLTAIAAAATLAVAAVAAPQPARRAAAHRRRHHRRARRRRHHRRGRSARALLRLRPRSYYYGPGPVYYRGPDCYWHPPASLGRLGLARGGACGFATRSARRNRAKLNRKARDLSQIPGFFELGGEPKRSNFRHIKPASFTGAGTGFKCTAWRSAPAGPDPGRETL